MKSVCEAGSASWTPTRIGSANCEIQYGWQIRTPTFLAMIPVITIIVQRLFVTPVFYDLKVRAYSLFHNHLPAFHLSIDDGADQIHPSAQFICVEFPDSGGCYLADECTGFVDEADFRRYE